MCCTGIAAEEPEEAQEDSAVKLEADLGVDDIKTDPEDLHGQARPAANGMPGTSGAAKAASGLSSAAAKALPDALLSLFKHNHTANLGVIRYEAVAGCALT